MSEINGELSLTKQGKMYFELVLTSHIRRHSSYACSLEQKFLIFNELVKVVARMCLLPRKSRATAQDLAREDLKKLTLADVKYFLFLLIKVSTDEKDLFKPSWTNFPKHEAYIWDFIKALQGWQITLPLLKLVSQNSVEVKKNPWFRRFCPAFQNFLKLEDIVDRPAKRLRFLSKFAGNYEIQQDKLYDSGLFPDLTPKGWRFLTFFEDFFVEKLLHADEISVASLAEQINSKFMESLINGSQFRQIMDESLKIVKINEHLDVRFIDGETLIFVEGKEFRQCTYILMVNPQEQEHHHQVNSIDEAQKFLSHGLERVGVSPSELGISAKEEFWAHCSNLQAWVEHDYDTRLLHSNLSFPLLKALARSDPLAKLRLQEEIVSRISARYFPVIMYLMTEEYYICLTPKQLEFLLEVLHEILAENLEDPSCSQETGNIEFFIQEIMDYIDLYVE